MSFHAQSSKWSDLFSYNNVKVIREDGDRIIAATENGIFYYYPGSGEIRKLSKANGLHDVKISAFDYNPATKTGIIGYRNGSLDVITPDGIFYIVDIPIATGTTNKTINHISISDDRAVISAGYGISIFNVSRREFGDTVFFPTLGASAETVNAAVIKDNKVYAATSRGIKAHDINTTFPLYTEWQLIATATGGFSKIAASGILAFSGKNEVRYGNGPAFSVIGGFLDIQDITVTPTNILVTDLNIVKVYSHTGVLQKTFDTGEDINTAFLQQSSLLVGTKKSGIYNEQKISIKPDGPYNNTSYKLSVLDGQIWVSTGRREDYDIARPTLLGYYHYDGNKWIYPEYFKQMNIAFNILDVVPNPSDPSEVFFTNMVQDAYKGIYKMKDDAFVKSYLTELNSTSVNTNRPIGLSFDENNSLFCSFSNAPNTAFYYFDRQSDKFTLVSTPNGVGAQKPLTKDGVLYIPVPFNNLLGGLLMYNYNNTPSNTADDSFKFLTKNNNFKVNETISVALDKNDDVWIGTMEGIRILSNPKAAILEANPQAEPIIIEENGLAEELFRDANILQIYSDSGNQKWVSVDGGGVFYISPNGDKTIYHFTKSNSPLPNDSVTDIKVDEKTGKVYFVTLDGIMVYQGDVTEVTSNFGNVLVYPNPVVYAQYKGNVRIRGLAAKTNIRITDAAGNLIHSAVANGGYFEWNLNNQRGVRVASGIYYVLMTNEDGTDTATAKIAVVN